MAKSEEDPDKRAIWGLKASVDVNIPGKWHFDNESVKMYSTDYGFAAGGVCNIYLPSNFYFEPGVSLYYDRYSYSDLKTTDTDGNLVDYNPQIHKFGIRIPAVFGYVFSITETMDMAVFTGPEFNIGLIGKVKSKNKTLISETIPENLYGNGMQHRFDLAWKFGVGFPIGSLFVSIDAAVGVTDIMPGNISYRDNRASVSMTYYFNN